MAERLRVLDLFSGIGGFSLGLERTGGFQTVAFCEIDPFCRRVLAKHWPDVIIHEDVTKLRGEDVGRVDVVCGGYPCQPFSHAGKREGSEDDRHLWPEMYRLLGELRPTWIIGENVAGHISMGLDTVLSDLDAIGYASRPFAIPACAVGAPHRRERVWIVAHTSSARLQGLSSRTVAAAGHGAGCQFGGDVVTGDAANAERGKQAQCGPAGRMGGAEQVPGPRYWPLASEPFVGIIYFREHRQVIVFSMG